MESHIITGEDCEEDFNGCQAEPCASGQTCTDVNATLHQQSGTAYECSACPPGYELNDNKCQGNASVIAALYYSYFDKISNELT